MHHKVISSLTALALLLSFFTPLVPTSVAPQPVRAELDTIVLDGEMDADYVMIAEDAQGDLASPGPADWNGVAWTDLTGLYVAADATTLYVYAPLHAYTETVSSGQIGLVIEVDGGSFSGGGSDPWANAIAFDYDTVNGAATIATLLPDYVIRGNVYSAANDGYTELRAWNGSEWVDAGGGNWGGITSGSAVGTHIAYSEAGGVEFAIPLADIGSPAPADVRLQLFATQDGDSKGAYDTVPSDSQSAGWDDPTIQHELVSVPLAVDPMDLASPGPADWEGTTWTELTRLHAWADHASLHLFVPMAAYDPTVSQGQILMAFQTKDGGGSTDPWGNAITFAYTTIWQNLGFAPVDLTETLLPDYVIRGNIFGDGANGWTELREWNGNWDTGGGTDWGGIGNSGQPSVPGSKIAWADGEGLRITIPFDDIGVSVGDVVHMQFIATQAPMPGGTKGAYDTLPDDDQSTGWDDATTQQVLASYEIPNVVSPFAAHDGIVWASDLGHDSRDPLYRTPTGAVTTEESVTLRLRAASGDLTGAKVRVYDDRNDAAVLMPMTLVADDGTYEWWQATIEPAGDPTIYWYRFIAIDGDARVYYEDDAQRTGGWGQAYGESPDRGWQLTVYARDYQTPEWIKNAVVYQIFPDRFRDGNFENRTPPGTFFYDEGPTIFRSTMDDWNTTVCDPRDENSCEGKYSQNFYGGDLQGIHEKLDYLEDLGVTALYFNPVFESPSNHKYDTRNFGVIDDNFAVQGSYTESLQLFQDLATEAHTRGIYIILDGVFNHSSSDSIYFDRYGRYESVGACESVDSPYRDWYYFTDVEPGEGPCVGSDGTPDAATYESWFGYDSLPKLQALNEEVKDYFWSGGEDSIGRYWMQWADGWRLDVAGHLDPGVTRDPENDYWEGFRAAVRETNPDAYIVGEEWGNASPWLLGNEWDATMNYPFGTAIMGFWRDETFTDNDHNAGSSAGPIVPLSPSQLDERVHYLAERYPEESFYAMMNLLDSHDTNRAVFMLDENTDDIYDRSVYEDPNYDWSDALHRLMGVALLQMTMPGAPTIYYGDEVGLVGPVTYSGGKWEDDPYNRIPYPWLDETGTPLYEHLQSGGFGQTVLLDYYKQLTAARNDHEALRTGDYQTLKVDDENGIYAYGRKTSGTDAAVVIANQGTTQTVTVDVAGYLPAGATFENVLDGSMHTVGTTGELSLDVPGRLGVLLVLTGTLDTPPAAVTDLAVADEGDQTLTLVWSAVTGADSYNVYRSMVSGGGYELVTNTTASTYVDTGLQNASNYYYVVTSVDDTALLESDYSNEATGIPHLIIGWANLSGPAEITHTIGITSTPPITGQVWIDGATSVQGPTEGLMAQLGYGTSKTPNIWTMWADAAYSHDLGNNDVFSTTLLPEELGDYYYVYRYSTTGGRDWFYADLSGPISATNIITAGELHVVSSGDVTAPAAPQNLEVYHWGPAHISLRWDAVTDLDLYAYDVYRYGEGETSADAQMIDRVMAPTTVYTDEAVLTGRTYTYTVQAVDTSFNKSADSNAASGTAEPRVVDLRFVVTVPEYTPENATIYIAGNDANVFGAFWSPDAQPITQHDATTWVYTTTAGEGTELQYKYTRGGWSVVESWGQVTGLNNRSVVIEYGATGVMTVTDEVYNWVDAIVMDHYPAAGATTWDPSAPITVSISTQLDTSAINTSTFKVTGITEGPVDGTFGFAHPVDTYSDAVYGTVNVTRTLIVFTPTTPLNDAGYSVEMTAPEYSWSFGATPELTVTKTVEHASVVSPGDTVTYTIVVENVGTVNAGNVVLTDVLPMPVYHVAWVGGSQGATVDGRTISWTGTITAGESLTLTFTARTFAEDETTFPTDGTITNTVTVAYFGQMIEDSASFDVRFLQKLYLPLVLRNYSP